MKNGPKWNIPMNSKKSDMQCELNTKKMVFFLNGLAFLLVIQYAKETINPFAPRNIKRNYEIL